MSVVQKSPLPWIAIQHGSVMVMLFNATFNNISVMSWWSVLLVEETGSIRRKPPACRKTLSHNVVLSTPYHERIQHDIQIYIYVIPSYENQCFTQNGGIWLSFLGFLGPNNVWIMYEYFGFWPFVMKVTPETRRSQYIWYPRFYSYKCKWKS